MRPSSAPHRSRGFSLIEAAIVLGIVGLVIGGIWAAASSVRERQQQTQMEANFGQVIHNLRRLLPTMGTANAQLINWTTNSGVGTSMNLIPKDWLNGTRVVPSYPEITQFGIDYDGAGNGFQIIIGGVSDRHCRTFLPYLTARHNLSGTISPSGSSFNPTRTWDELKGYCANNSTIYISVY